MAILNSNLECAHTKCDPSLDGPLRRSKIFCSTYM